MFLTEDKITEIGFKKVGKEVKISDKASFYNPGNISIGDYTRIDDFSVLSAGAGGIEIGRNVHISTFCFLVGKGKITLSDFSSLSSGCNIFSSSDDYSGEALVNPTIPSEYLNVKHADVYLGECVTLGAGVVILPGVRLEEGCVVGALSLVKENCKAWGKYVGIPVRYIGERNQRMLSLKEKYLNE